MLGKWLISVLVYALGSSLPPLSLSVNMMFMFPRTFSDNDTQGVSLPASSSPPFCHGVHSSVSVTSAPSMGFCQCMVNYCDFLQTCFNLPLWVWPVSILSFFLWWESCWGRGRCRWNCWNKPHPAKQAMKTRCILSDRVDAVLPGSKDRGYSQLSWEMGVSAEHPSTPQTPLLSLN